MGGSAPLAGVALAADGANLEGVFNTVAEARDIEGVGGGEVVLVVAFAGEVDLPFLLAFHSGPAEGGAIERHIAGGECGGHVARMSGSGHGADLPAAVDAFGADGAQADGIGRAGGEAGEGVGVAGDGAVGDKGFSPLALDDSHLEVLGLGAEVDSDIVLVDNHRVDDRSVADEDGTIGNYNIVDGGGRIGTHAQVVAPHEDQEVAAGSDVNSVGHGAPGAVEVQLAALGIEINPTRGIICVAFHIARITASRECGIARSEPSKEEVIIALAIGFPVETEGISTGIGETEGAGSIRITGSSNLVGIGGAIVLTDVESLAATIVSGIANIPTITVSLVVDNPVVVIGSGGLKASHVGERGHGVRINDANHTDAGVIAIGIGCHEGNGVETGGIVDNADRVAAANHHSRTSVDHRGIPSEGGGGAVAFNTDNTIVAGITKVEVCIAIEVVHRGEDITNAHIGNSHLAILLIDSMESEADGLACISAHGQTTPQENVSVDGIDKHRVGEAGFGEVASGRHTNLIGSHSVGIITIRIASYHVAKLEVSISGGGDGDSRSHQPIVSHIGATSCYRIEVSISIVCTISGTLSPSSIGASSVEGLPANRNFIE